MYIFIHHSIVENYIDIPYVDIQPLFTTEYYFNASKGFLQDCLHRLDLNGYECQASSLVGTVKEEIKYELKRIDPSLVIFGHNHYNIIKRRFYESIPEFCLRTLNCPVCIVKC